MGSRTLAGEKMKRTYTDIYGTTLSLNHPCLFSVEDPDPYVYREVIPCFEWGDSIKYIRSSRRSPLHPFMGCSHKGVTSYQRQYRILSDGYNIRVFRGDLYDVWR